MRSPFTGLRFARLELDNFRAGTMIKLALCAIALIPLIYAGLFLLAFLDPYGSLVNVPAAVVNLDSGDTIDGDERNIGQELCDELVKNNENRTEGEASGYDWKFVDGDAAWRGLEDGTYYMELVIPENFSAAIASADTDDPENAELQAYFNPSTNLIAQTVGSSMVTKIRAELNYRIGKEYYDNIFVKIDDAADQLQTAVDGSDTLSSGLDELEDGSSSLTTGLESAESGSGSLEDGLSQLEDGSATLTEGIDAASAGAKKLQKGARSAKSGSDTITKSLKKLESGAKSADSGAQTIYENMDALIDGLETAESAITLIADGDGTSSNPGISGIATQLGQASTDVSTLTDQVTALGTDATVTATALTSVYSSMEQAENSQDPYVAALAKQVIASLDAKTQTGKSAKESADAVAGDIASIQATAASLAQQMSQLDAAVAGLQLYAANLDAIANGGAVTDASGAKTTTGGISSAVTGATQLKKGVKELKSGLDQLASGTTKLRKGSATLTSGLGTLSTGTGSLVLGLGKASSGSSTITENLGTAKDGASDLSDGLSTAASGSSTITQGLQSAAQGADELHDGLEDGQQQLEDSVDGADAKAEMMSEPVTANGENQTGESITEVRNYGTGFAPYFISLGMWVGALMISMVVNVLNRRILMSGASSISAVLASYFPMLLVSFAQVILLLLVIQFALGMRVQYPLAFYLFGLLTSVCFVAIVQFFRAALGTTGMVVIVVLLMLQLCTAAGTFPIEAELPVFNWLNPFLPMTYVVHGFRMCMAGLSLDYLARDVAVLLLFSLAFLFFTFLWARHRRTVTMSMLYPPLKLSD